jgi:flagellar hook-associated protein 2
MSTITSPTYDPTSTATALAQKSTAALQQTLTDQTKSAADSAKALTSLRSAIVAFQGSLTSLTGLNQTMYAQAATFSDTTVGSATASASAIPGTYGFFVAKIATAGQVSYAGLQDDTSASGNLTINLGGGAGGSFSVDLSKVNGGVGPLSVSQIAAAINGAAGNNSLVTASVISTGAGTSQLVLTAKNTGANSAITLASTGGVTGSLAAPAGTTEVIAQDAEVYVGSEGSSTKLVQSSNTFTNVAGVKMTFTRAQASGSAPVTVTVGADGSGTQKNVQAFVDGYNKLKEALDALVDPGDPASNVAGGTFAHDAGVRALRDRLISLMRPAGATTLASYGITAQKDGSLALDTTVLSKKLAVNPTGLDTLIGSTSASAPSGIANALNTFLNSWSNSATGQINQRKAANDKLQKSLTDRQGDLDAQYNAAYQRYLMQFTKLQTLQSQMTNNASMFDALFGNNKSD